MIHQLLAAEVILLLFILVRSADLCVHGSSLLWRILYGIVAVLALLALLIRLAGL